MGFVTRILKVRDQKECTTDFQNEQDQNQWCLTLTVSEIASYKEDSANSSLYAAIFNQVNRLFQMKMNEAGHGFIDVDEGDFKFAGTVPDMRPEDKRELRVDTFDTKWKGSIGKDSKLKTEVSWKDEDLNAFLEADLDAGLDVGSQVRVTLGAKVFGHRVKRLARKTVHVDFKAHGKALLRARIG